MASSDVYVCNLALLRVGVNGTIDSLAAASAEARACALLYNETRDRVLSARPWSFAVRRADLAALEDVERSGWGYAYGVPTDCLRALSIWCGLRRPRPDERVPFAIEGDATHGRILLCDEEATADSPVELSYVARVTAPGLFPSAFTSALAWALAHELAIALALEQRLADRAAAHYERALSEAASLFVGEGEADVEPDAAHIAERY